MIYNIAEGVTYDTENLENNDEFWQYYSSNIATTLGEPTARDKFKRPVEYRVDGVDCVIVIIRSYIHDNVSWAKKSDEVSVIGKEVENG